MKFERISRKSLTIDKSPMLFCVSKIIIIIRVAATIKDLHNYSWYFSRLFSKFAFHLRLKLEELIRIFKNINSLQIFFSCFQASKFQIIKHDMTYFSPNKLFRSLSKLVSILSWVQFFIRGNNFRNYPSTTAHQKSLAGFFKTEFRDV